jgi:2-dehydro-3-deoxyphosphooctonate aldolase (KDO 8-P synthase)
MFKIKDDFYIGKELFFILGPCVIESEKIVFQIAEQLKTLSEKHSFKFVFKASFDKANRTSINSFRGPGMIKGLSVLKKVKEKFDIPVLTDIHEPYQAEPVAEVVDIIQIPAFLSRQTDLLLAAGRTQKPVNIKKGQFSAPWDMKNIYEKIISTGNKKIFFTERGTSFGYNNLIVDITSIPLLKKEGFIVIIDATHSVQKPSAEGNRTGGRRDLAPYIARAGVSVGADGVFMEVHPNPDKALSDGPNSIRLKELDSIILKLLKIRRAIDD